MPATTGLRCWRSAPATQNDIVYYPRSGKVSLRGVGVRFRVDPLDYWDGEPG